MRIKKLNTKNIPEKYGRRKNVAGLKAHTKNENCNLIFYGSLTYDQSWMAVLD